MNAGRGRADTTLEYAAEHEPNVAIKVTGMTVSVDGWPPNPPTTLGITVGEVVYNLRAALDYAVFELSRDQSGKANMRTQFPIEHTPEAFVARTRPTRRGKPNHLTGVSPGHVAIIERQQPYNGDLWLEFLRDLSNEDKHRTIPVLGDAGHRAIRVGGTDEEMLAAGASRRPGNSESWFYPSPVAAMLNSEPPAPVVETLELLSGKVLALIDELAGL